jgi:hypothetical protein
VPPLLRLLLIFVLVFIGAYLLCVFFGGLLATVAIAQVAYVGKFLTEWAGVIALVFAGWAVINGSGWNPFRRAA